MSSLPQSPSSPGPPGWIHKLESIPIMPVVLGLRPSSKSVLFRPRSNSPSLTDEKTHVHTHTHTHPYLNCQETPGALIGGVLKQLPMEFRDVNLCGQDQILDCPQASQQSQSVSLATCNLPGWGSGEGGILLPAVHAIPKERCSEHCSTRVHPAQEGKPHSLEIHCQATGLF